MSVASPLKTMFAGGNYGVIASSVAAYERFEGGKSVVKLTNLTSTGQQDSAGDFSLNIA
jgi:hypothetical protein